MTTTTSTLKVKGVVGGDDDALLLLCFGVIFSFFEISHTGLQCTAGGDHSWTEWGVLIMGC